MKFISIAALFLSLMATGAVMVESHRQESPSDDIEKRATKNTDLLSNISCRYLKIKGYFKKIPSLKKLCPATYHCNDLLSQNSCNILKTKKECKKDSSLSLTYCRFTCNRCYVPHCKNPRPLGMESGAIPDSSITASSIYSSGSYAAHMARLNNKNKKNYYGWAAKTNTLGQWIQVDLRKVTYVTGVATQGNKGGSEWVTSYSLQYSVDGKSFAHYQAGKTFKGNSDHNTVVKHDLQPAIYARYIKLFPKTWRSHMTLRMELYGCK